MELFDILQEDGTPTGVQKERETVHQNGDLHGSVRIWLIREGTVLLQKRALNKDSYPGCYDVASSGHIDAGEDAITAAIREVQEEINLTITKDDLIPLFTQRLHVDVNQISGRFISNEVNTVYMLRKELNLTSVSGQRSEIDSLRWIPMPDLLTALRENNSNYCIPLSECERVFTYYSQYRQLSYILRTLKEGIRLKEGILKPHLYLHKVEDATLYAFSLSGEEIIKIENSLLQNNGLDHYMWIGVLQKKDGSQFVVAIRDKQSEYKVLTDDLLHVLHLSA